MANRERGEVSLVVDGRPYVLRPSLNAMCELEDAKGKPFTQIAAAAQAGSVSALRSLVWTMLQDHHGEEIKTERDAGLWIERAGGMTKVEAALQQTMTLNAGTDADGGAGASAGPHPAQVLTGVVST